MIPRTWKSSPWLFLVLPLKELSWSRTVPGGGAVCDTKEQEHEPPPFTELIQTSVWGDVSERPALPERFTVFRLQSLDYSVYEFGFLTTGH